MKPQNTLTENSQYVEMVHWNGMTGKWKRYFVVRAEKKRNVCTMRILNGNRRCLRRVTLIIARRELNDKRYHFVTKEETSREVAYTFKPLLVAVGMIPTGVFTRVRRWEE